MRSAAIFPVLFAALLLTAAACGAVLDKQKLLDRQTFWDNRDWDWYQANIPFFESPDADIDTTYYYRWELVTKHLTYGSPDSGYSFTEFIDRPFWSGAYGAISCPAGHQLYEVRWLRGKRVPQDYARYWFRTPGAQPRRYSTWLADAVWAVHQVHPDAPFIQDLLADLVKNYQGWEKEHFDEKVGLFWQTGHDDGMEYNINSRQTTDIVRGAPGFRPTLNAYMWADALAIAKVADLAGDAKTATAYRSKAASIKRNMQALCWDPKREFFLHVFRDDETAEGHTVKALTKTYETGKYAGSPHGREEIGFVPWQFGMPEQGKGYERAWKFLMDDEYFAAPFGPTTVERQDPQFVLKRTCCWWSGMSWPYATTQTLRGMANLLHDYAQDVVIRKDYIALLRTYARTHTRNGGPYIAEAAHPITGSWEGHNSYNHSEHYFHSGYVDLVITGLVGLKVRDDDVIEIDPLAPADWAYFALDDLRFKGHDVAILWDADGSRYGRGRGLHILVDGKPAASAEKLGRLSARLPPAPAPPDAGRNAVREVNYAVNNDGHYFPRVTASSTAPGTQTSKLVDGNYWYHVDPPNRWMVAGSADRPQWVEIDFGIDRPIHAIKACFLDDTGVKHPVARPPAQFEVERFENGAWKAIPGQAREPERPAGRRANIVSFPQTQIRRFRLKLTPREGFDLGLTELEAWGPASGPVAPAPPPAGNLAYNPGDRPFPKISASFTSRFDKVEEANDGKVSFSPSPRNRWTSYESPSASDWLEVDFGQDKAVGRVELAIYDDRGGVRAPGDYRVQFWSDGAWKDVAHPQRSPEKPAGGQFNELRFDPVKASKLRVVFTHADKARSGVSEIFIWPG